MSDIFAILAFVIGAVIGTKVAHWQEDRRLRRIKVDMKAVGEVFRKVYWR